MTELNFKGKEFVYNHHLAVPFRPLVPHSKKGIGPVAFDGNLIIHGDNLHALKALLPLYAGKVDCVYIDPPYNTGNKEWSYSDNVNAPMIREWLTANPISLDDGLRHDKWCAMMWPRLRMLGELLSPEGAAFISINSIEYARLKSMCDEIFGEDQYIGEFVWKSRNNKDNRNENGLSNDHEFVLIYGGGLDGELRSAADYSNPDGDNRGPWASANMVGLASKDKRPNLHFDLINPATKINYGCPKRGWRFEPATMKRLIAERRILWPEKKDGRPRRKSFLSELDARTNVSSVTNGVFYTNNGSKEFGQILPEAEFPFPKPIELIQFILSLFERQDLLVLDSFAGSGSTAHGVLQANKLDGGSRRFILVEMEDYADKLTAERVRRVIKGYKFEGTQKTELLREYLNWRAIERAEDLVQRVKGIENLEGPDFDRVTKQVKGGELIVTGEKAVTKRAEGLGGAFTYCTLDDPVELDKVLSGESLPSYAAIGTALFHMATNQALDPKAIRQKDFYLGETESQHVWLIYKPDLNWLKTPTAALTLDQAKIFAGTDPEKRHLVFAPARFVSQKMLGEQNLPVEFVPLPFALYRIDRG
ncbi:site-specific DNA-methyltransferase [Bradyrhizobium erythrophlei]|uniref:site-specific DNA-methyltransferase (adenine-specific) n=1 Tax=Bradyrhizobium erythrophlei TaxID=1437360 RepID=A0A1M5NTV5_9BRAD|nr:site-specific DNA-methyltransferase [Bradyrhizobium erythrophlei]SHG92996.1 adenine-specific DNA-methyltransferase [Bradyrhizobium erythrophlei]